MGALLSRSSQRRRNCTWCSNARKLLKIKFIHFNFCQKFIFFHPLLTNQALAFLGKMYFFSTQERLENFKTNPRKYLLPQVPRNPVRVAVTGQPSAAKSSLVQALATHYSCEGYFLKISSRA